MNTIKPGMRSVPGTREYNRCNIALSTVFLTTILVASALAQGSGYIYWVDKVSFFSFTNKIRRADCGDGTIIEDLITGDSINGIALDLTNGHIYWIEYAVPGQIRRADLDGTNDQTVISSLHPRPVNRGVGIALDVTNGHIYWAEQILTAKIRRADLDGSNDQDLSTLGGAMLGSISLDLINNHIYRTERVGVGAEYRIRRSDLMGNDDPIGFPNIFGHKLALDLTNNYFYWAETGNDMIRRADLDGTNDLTVNIPGGVNNPFTVALDLINNHIYWTEANLEPGAGAVRRANLDGTDPVDHITIPGAWGSSIALQIGSSSNCSSGSGSGSQNIRYVPFKSQYVLLVLLALLGVWFVLRRR